MKNKLIIIIFSIIFSLINPGVARSQSVLQEIQQTGVLKVGMRKDAAPFGYVSSSNWEGICIELMNEFKEDLEKKLNQTINIEKLETILDEDSEQGRHSSVANKRVHLECGPNTIRKNPPTGVIYSESFFTTGTYLMMKPDRRITVDSNGFMKGILIGVLKDSLTQKFIESRYQLADRKVYPGASGRAAAVKDAIAGTIDAFASDGILLEGEAFREGLKETQYSIEPNRPLTCISYGMILPTNDSEWEKTVNEYIRVKVSISRTIEILTKLTGATSPLIGSTISASDKCSGL
ncbi:MAG: transporter substrate-binding domain-containing protein [Okeania sp. SIO3B5]|uniref:transporter substrate-binding domain-containing protein n=1 Tax=Okeania sp. SIO3B5 TaxID=2607811 RepID=UPI0014018500|nr:transporter substrate-binding domain-containing protein [Okeania sp. SIO3B5]NEO55554.1 transporter substrate-binding domain-containing protein [Okeania sp. SIO3B5]